MIGRYGACVIGRNGTCARLGCAGGGCLAKVFLGDRQQSIPTQQPFFSGRCNADGFTVATDACSAGMLGVRIGIGGVEHPAAAVFVGAFSRVGAGHIRVDGTCDLALVHLAVHLDARVSGISLEMFCCDHRALEGGTLGSSTAFPCTEAVFGELFVAPLGGDGARVESKTRFRPVCGRAISSELAFVSVDRSDHLGGYAR